MQDVSPTQATAHQPAPSHPPGTRGRVSKFVIPEVIFGIGTLAEVGGAVRRVGGHRPMLVSDPGVLAAGWVDRALPHLADVRVQSCLWHGLTPNPKDFEVAAAFESYRENGCDALLAIGGGSCIDVAKAVAVLSGNGGRILDYEGIDRATSPIPPMVMVPTTGGSGADVSQFCVVTDTVPRSEGDDRRSGAGTRDLGHRPRAPDDDAGRADRPHRPRRAQPRDRVVRLRGMRLPQQGSRHRGDRGPRRAPAPGSAGPARSRARARRWRGPASRPGWPSPTRCWARRTPSRIRSAGPWTSLMACSTRSSCRT